MEKSYNAIVTFKPNKGVEGAKVELSVYNGNSPKSVFADIIKTTNRIKPSMKGYYMAFALVGISENGETHFNAELSEYLANEIWNELNGLDIV